MPLALPGSSELTVNNVVAPYLIGDTIGTTPVIDSLFYGMIFDFENKYDSYFWYSASPFMCYKPWTVNNPAYPYCFNLNEWAIQYPTLGVSAPPGYFNRRATPPTAYRNDNREVPLTDFTGFVVPLRDNVEQNNYTSVITGSANATTINERVTNSYVIAKQSKVQNVFDNPICDNSFAAMVIQRMLMNYPYHNTIEQASWSMSHDPCLVPGHMVSLQGIPVTVRITFWEAYETSQIEPPAKQFDFSELVGSPAQFANAALARIGDGSGYVTRIDIKTQTISGVRTGTMYLYNGQTGVQTPIMTAGTDNVWSVVQEPFTYVMADGTQLRFNGNGLATIDVLDENSNPTTASYAVLQGVNYNMTTDKIVAVADETGTPTNVLLTDVNRVLTNSNLMNCKGLIIRDDVSATLMPDLRITNATVTYTGSDYSSALVQFTKVKPSASIIPGDRLTYKIEANIFAPHKGIQVRTVGDFSGSSFAFGGLPPSAPTGFRISMYLDDRLMYVTYPTVTT
jgi:hypothetical protein